MSEYRALPRHPMPAFSGYFEPKRKSPAQVRRHSPAVFVMTDLRHHTAQTIEPNASIECALDRMKSVGVRLLLVVNSDKAVFGLITATDILGEKPMQFHEALNLRHEEIRVRDIMVPQQHLEVLHIEDVLRASVGDIVETLRAVSRRHALVLDSNPADGRPAIRGILSITQIGKQLGEDIDCNDAAPNFVECEVALGA